MAAVAQSKEFLNSSVRLKAILVKKFGPSNKDSAAVLTTQMY